MAQPTYPRHELHVIQTFERGAHCQFPYRVVRCQLAQGESTLMTTLGYYRTQDAANEALERFVQVNT